MSTTNTEKPFTPGETIDFCDDHYVVLENYGTTGKVREAGPGGKVISPFYWNFQGSVCTRLAEAA